MTMTRTQIIILAGAGSLAMLLGAWGFQYIGGLAPCQMCYWQRWPHMAAVAIAAAALAVPGTPARIWPVLGALAALTTAGLGLYHAGVEQNWWSGPATCSAGDVGGLSPEELLNQIMNAPLVRCDEIAWSMLGLSMAAWNAIASTFLAAIWLAAAQVQTRT